MQKMKAGSLADLVNIAPNSVLRLRRKVMLPLGADRASPHQSGIRRVVSPSNLRCWPSPAVPRSADILLIPNR